MARMAKNHNYETHLSECEAKIVAAVAARDKKAVTDVILSYTHSLGAPNRTPPAQRIFKTLATIPDDLFCHPYLMMIFKRKGLTPDPAMAALLKRVLKRAYDFDDKGNPRRGVQESLRVIAAGFEGYAISMFDDMKPETSTVVGDVIAEYLEAARQEDLEHWAGDDWPADVKVGILDRKRINLDEAMKWALYFYCRSNVNPREEKDPNAPINVKIMEKYKQFLDARLALTPDEMERFDYLAGLVDGQKNLNLLVDRITALFDASKDQAALSRRILDNRQTQRMEFMPLWIRAKEMLGIVDEDDTPTDEVHGVPSPTI